MSYKNKNAHDVECPVAVSTEIIARFMDKPTFTQFMDEYEAAKNVRVIPSKPSRKDLRYVKYYMTDGHKSLSKTAEHFKEEGATNAKVTGALLRVGRQAYERYEGEIETLD